MKRVLVIGAGPAGLTAAYQLLKTTDVKPIVLEASPFIGGISRTHEYNGNRMDLGGHRFFTKCPEVMRLWLDLMPLQGAPARDDLLLARSVRLSQNGPDPEQEDDVMLLRRRVSRIYFLRKFFDYPIRMSQKTFSNMGFRRTVRAGFGYLAAMLKKREERSLEDFYINRFGRPLYEMFFEDYTRKVWGIHPSKISPDWGSQRVKGLSLLGILRDLAAKAFHVRRAVETSLIEEFYYPKRGPGQIYEKMASEITRMGGEILTQTEAVQIEIEKNRVVSVRAKRADGSSETFEICAVFSSMAVKDLIAAMGDSPGPDVSAIAASLPYRDFITVGLLVKKLSLQNDSGMQTVGGLVPDCWIYVQDRSVKLGRVQIFNNWSPYLVARPDTVWIGLEYFCAEGDDMWNMPAEAFINEAISEAERIGVLSRDDVLDTEHIRVKKAYPAYFGAYAQFGSVKAYLQSIENLYCIGRNGQHRYNNMDHSMKTAIDAVEAFRSGGAGKDAIWQINTEEAYHETDRSKNA
jgi:protoporphyrinogen oxidase